jgi:hypothetical protein
MRSYCGRREVIDLAAKEIVALVVVGLTLAGAGVYIRQIIQRVAKPIKATWIIFASVTGLCLSSFLANRFDLVSGAANCADLCFGQQV